MYYEMRNISSQRKLLTAEVACQLIISLVLLELDYCHSLYAFLNISLMNYNLYNIVLIEFTKKKIRSYKPILTTLHWLPVHGQIKYKITTPLF